MDAAAATRSSLDHETGAGANLFRAMIFAEASRNPSRLAATGCGIPPPPELCAMQMVVDCVHNR